MKRMRLVWMVVGLVMCNLVGCSDDDSDSDGAGVVTTNLLNVTTVVVTNGTEASASPFDAERKAPQLVAPASGAEYTVYLIGGQAKVDFLWTALPGVDSYSLQMESHGGGYVFGGNSATLNFEVGTYTWWVEGRYPTSEELVENGPPSGKSTFTVKQGYFDILSPL